MNNGAVTPAASPEELERLKNLFIWGTPGPPVAPVLPSPVTPSAWPPPKLARAPFYECASGVLYCGDCLEVMQELVEAGAVVDAVVTDPPYCSGGLTENSKKQAQGQGLRSEILRRDGWFTNDNMTTAGLIWLLRSVMNRAHAMLRDGGSALTFTDWRMLTHLAPALESSGLRFQNVIVWDKDDAGLGFGFRARHEMILQHVKGTGVYYAKDGHNVINNKRVPSTAKQHPTEKPLELMQELIRVVTDKGQTIIDPFAGSGTALKAAQKLGRKFIGIELSPQYCATIREKLEGGPC